MKIPGKGVGAFAMELKDYCLYSQKTRLDIYRNF
jgi:hypothetical protein